MKTLLQPQTRFQKIADLLPLVLIAVGLALDWLGFAFAGIFLVLGFFLYGAFGLIISIKRKYYKGLSMRSFKIVNDIAIILLTLAFLYGRSTMFYLLMLILLDRLILLRSVDKE